MEKHNNKPFEGASWISIPKEAQCPPDSIYGVWFRQHFRWTGESITMKIAAHLKYKVFINGHRVGAGPCQGDRWHAYYDEWDISDDLNVGDNEILVFVMYYPPECFNLNTQGGPMASVGYITIPCLVLNANHPDLVTGSEGWQVAVDTSITWVNQKLPAFTCIGPVEEVVLSQSPLMCANQLNWVSPMIVGEAHHHGFGEHSPFMIMDRPIPPLLEKDENWVREMPIREDDQPSFTFVDGCAVIPSGETWVCELDAGVLQNAYLITKLKGQGRVRFIYAECYVEVEGHYYKKGVRDDWENFRVLGFSDQVTIDGEGVYEPFDWRCFRFIRVEVESTGAPIEIALPRIVATGYPMEIKAEIQGDGHWVEPLWAISIRTLERCMHERYMDCPYYERMQYALDTRLQALFTYRLSGDTRLAKKAIRDFHSTLTPDGMLTSRAPTNRYNVIPNFALHFIMMLEEYYIQTGDADILRRYTPTVDAVLGWFEHRVNEDGMVCSPGYWNFIDWCGDWANEEDILLGAPRIVDETGISATNTLQYAAGLQSTSRIMNAIGRLDTAKTYEQRANQVNQSVLDHCMGEDGLLYEVPHQPSLVTQHAQVWAVLTGAVTGKRAEWILLNSMSVSVHQCTFVMRFFLLRALEKVGRYDMADEILAPWREALDVGLTTWPEDFARQRSDCHAWSALPLYEFTSGILGVNPLEPGWKRILIKPNPLTLNRARGKVPTPHGFVEVSWEISDRFHITCTAPEGIPVTVVLPHGEQYGFVGGETFNL